MELLSDFAPLFFRLFVALSIAEDWQFYQRFGDARRRQFSGIIEDALSEEEEKRPDCPRSGLRPRCWRQIEKNIGWDKLRRVKKGRDDLVARRKQMHLGKCIWNREFDSIYFCCHGNYKYQIIKNLHQIIRKKHFY